jgi:hypothetical protein
MDESEKEKYRLVRNRLILAFGQAALTLGSLPILLPVHYTLSVLGRRGVFRDGRVRIDSDSLKRKEASDDR